MSNIVTGYWKKFLDKELSLNYMRELNDFLEEEISSGKKIYPAQDDIYNAFSFTPFEKVEIVILGQDPYHQPNQAHGLSFSVQDGIKLPPSLRNIFKELNRDLGIDIPESGNLSGWAKQGVFLLNTVLTVEDSNAGSHRKKGWEILTKKAIKEINDNKQNVVFLAWGKDAHKLCEHIDITKHIVIKTSHPSPLGARKNGKDFVSFLNSGCFSQANKYLESCNLRTIKWEAL